jgi:hypothetical protein
MDARFSILAATVVAPAIGAWMHLVIPRRRPLAVGARTYRPEDHHVRGPSLILPADLAATTELPHRPDPSILNDAIPLFYIGRNRDGFWVARDADGRVGGIFLRKQSALKFANRNAQPAGCAIMYLSEIFELDIENEGNPLAACLGPAMRVLTRLVSRLTSFIIGTATRRD